VLTTLANFVGGLGLFLVGMWLLTDGLKLAAGDAPRSILGYWTNSRLRGLLAGFFITGLVQSSSAVTVAAIGFANAGLLTLEQAVWVIFGSNVGTIMTGWIVALLGFKVDVNAFAVPLVGIGMIVNMTGGQSRRAAIGQAVIGLGLLFMGIGELCARLSRSNLSSAVANSLPTLLRGGQSYVQRGHRRETSRLRGRSRSPASNADSLVLIRQDAGMLVMCGSSCPIGIP
jgi:phosphate:Na+ symporter